MAFTYNYHQYPHQLPPPPAASDMTAAKILRATILMVTSANFISMLFYSIRAWLRRSDRPVEPPAPNPTDERGCDTHVDIPVVVIQSSQPPAALSCYESDCCFICLGSFSNGDEVRVLPNCNHIFHKDCIDMWLSASALPSCPVCRVRVIEPVVPPAGPS